MEMRKELEVFTTNILVITRDPQFLHVVYPVLKNRCYHVSSSAAVGHGLKELVNGIKPHLVIIDIMMPLMAGIKIALRIHRWSSVSTLLLTCWGAGPGAVRQLDVNDPECLSTPITSDKLGEWIDSIVTRHTNED